MPPARQTTLPRPTGAPLSGANLVERVLYRDGLMLVIDKPAGIAVHAGPGGGPNLEAMFDALRFGWSKPPALAHRLDRDTSGCLVLGRHPKALRKLGALFAAGNVEKTYWAIVQGAPPDDDGTVDQALRKVTRRDGGWRMVVDPDGQAALTHYRVRGRSGDLAWLELRPRTGRTHQIRVHCAVLGCPIVGDPLYGPPAAPGRSLPPLHLHARALVIPLKEGKPPITAEAPPPAHMLEALEACGYTPRPA
ncbi:RNA pseudouridine synthase [Vineibacter terrae]|uniref:RNA pseudouridine synthase n=1 Tax=Vineibacter terrae TaxID=2586908 RepID=A0A5C8P6V1_9HYPH|nr:RNA pseudouridine synthase [Vineibacter terrae]TXL69119.1 RNA pseudouridine synthase [Vineibacter terrae]